MNQGWKRVSVQKACVCRASDQGRIQGDGSISFLSPCIMNVRGFSYEVYALDTPRGFLLYHCESEAIKRMHSECIAMEPRREGHQMKQNKYGSVHRLIWAT